MLGLLQSLEVYDCTTDGTKTMAINLMEPNFCERQETYFTKPDRTTVQIMALDDRRAFQAYQCVVTLDSDVTRCGFDSLTYGTHHPYDGHQLVQSPEACWNMVRRKKICPEKKTCFPLEFGVTSRHSYHPQGHGYLHPDGKCETGSFTVNGIYFANSYEQRTMTVTIKKVDGIMDEASGQALLLDRIRTPYDKKSFQDSIHGTVIWKTTQPKCVQSVSEIYLGPANLHRHRNSTVGSFIVLANNRTQQFGGFLLKKETSVCKTQAFETQIRNIVIRVLRKGDAALPHTGFKDALQQTETRLLSHVAYLHLSTNQNHETQFQQVYQDLCTNKRNTVINKLRMLSHSGNQYTALDLFGPGHTVYRAGAVAYVTQCALVNATIRPMKNCSHDIPISYGAHMEEPAFADPISFIIKAHTSFVPCNPMSPIIFYLDKQWWCASPDLRKCAEPIKIDVTTDSKHLLRDYAAELNADMYTEDQRAVNKHYLLFANAREPILNQIGYKSYQNGKQGEETGVPVSPGDYKLMGDIIGMQISPAYFVFGVFWFYIWSALTILGLIKILLDTMVNVYLALKQRPLGWWILRVLCHSGFLLIMFPMHILAAARAQEEPVRNHNDYNRAGGYGPGYTGYGHHGGPELDNKVNYDNNKERLESSEKKGDTPEKNPGAKIALSDMEDHLG